MAAARPEAVAIVENASAVSYQVLDAASDAYAAQLAERGALPGQIIPFILPRSSQLVALQLAVLKCGAAYVNLDAAWPAERQARIIEQVRPPFVVARDATFTGAVGVFDPGGGDLLEAAGGQRGFTSPSVGGDDPATVFFTSGTTGKPKGIVVPHRAVTRLFRSGGLAGFGAGHAIPQAAALAWDMYAFEVWGQLTTGGSLVFAKSGHLMPSELRELIDTAGVDSAWLTTSLFNLFVDEDLECFDGLRHMYTGGEKASASHARAFLNRYPGVSLHNGYGPAENCMLTTTRLVEPDDCDIPEGIPVGEAVPGSAVFVLGDLDRRCAPGELGEVCVAGEGLAIGYLGQPQLTAERFPSVQIGGTPQRIYRTGDIGLIDDLGVLHFRGRRDRQVKISGHRIELAEIETSARALDAVRECMVIPLADDTGRTTSLALCYTAEPAQRPGENAIDDVARSSESEVRRALRQILPVHLMPGVVRKIDRFPMTANGKVDQSSLRDMVTNPRHSP